MNNPRKALGLLLVAFTVVLSGCSHSHRVANQHPFLYPNGLSQPTARVRLRHLNEPSSATGWSQQPLHQVAYQHPVEAPRIASGQQPLATPPTQHPDASGVRDGGWTQNAVAAPSPNLVQQDSGGWKPAGSPQQVQGYGSPVAEETILLQPGPAYRSPGGQESVSNGSSGQGILLTQEHDQSPTQPEPFPNTQGEPVYLDEAPYAPSVISHDWFNLSNWWLRTDYLVWRTKGTDVPELVTASPFLTPQDAVGVLGRPGTSLLFGDTGINDDWRDGVRFSATYWFDRCQLCGLEANFFGLSDERTGFRATSNGDPSIARPFFDASTGQQASQLVSLPNRVAGLNPGVAGSVRVASQTELWGTEINWRENIWSCDCCRLDWLIGYRYLDLNDELQIRENLVQTNLSNPVEPGTSIRVRDSFDTDNRFHGGQFGLAGEKRWGRWTLGGVSKIALGTSHKVVEIQGSTVTKSSSFRDTSRQRGGLLAQPTNIGHHRDHEFAVVPEIGLELGYDVTDNLRLFAGYTFIYWSNVARAGEQVDTVVNETQIPNRFSGGGGGLTGAPRPRLRFEDDDFWAHGLNFGIELRR